MNTYPALTVILISFNFCPPEATTLFRLQAGPFIPASWDYNTAGEHEKQ